MVKVGIAAGYVATSLVILRGHSRPSMAALLRNGKLHKLNINLLREISNLLLKMVSCLCEFVSSRAFASNMFIFCPLQASGAFRDWPRLASGKSDNIRKSCNSNDDHVLCNKTNCNSIDLVLAGILNYIHDIDRIGEMWDNAILQCTVCCTWRVQIEWWSSSCHEMNDMHDLFQLFVDSSLPY